MSDERLGNLGELVMQEFSFPLYVVEQIICKEFVTKHNRKCVLQVFYMISMSS